MLKRKQQRSFHCSQISFIAALVSCCISLCVLLFMLLLLSPNGFFRCVADYATDEMMKHTHTIVMLLHYILHSCSYLRQGPTCMHEYYHGPFLLLSFHTYQSRWHCVTHTYDIVNYPACSLLLHQLAKAQQLTRGYGNWNKCYPTTNKRLTCSVQGVGGNK